MLISCDVEEVLHIAVNTPQIYQVPKSQRSRLLSILQSTLQKRVMMFLDGCDDPEEISHRQFEATKFRSRVMNQVYQLLREEREKEIATSSSIANGFEYYFNEDGIQLFQNPVTNNVVMQEQVVSESIDDPFEIKRRRMNDEYFDSLLHFSMNDGDDDDNDQEEEAQKVRMYTNLSELMSTNDPSVKQYPNELTLSMVGGDQKLFEELLAMGAGTGEMDEMREVEKTKDSDNGKSVGNSGKTVETKELNGLAREIEISENESESVTKVDQKVDQKAGDKSEQIMEERKKVENIGLPENESKVEIKVENSELKKEIELTNSSLSQNSQNIDETEVKSESSILLTTNEITEKSNSPSTDIDTDSQMNVQSSNKDPDLTEETQDRLNETNLSVDESVDPTPSEQVKQLLEATTEQLEQIKQDLLQKYRHFSSQNAFVSENVIFDIVEILRIFGIPYVFAPGEAEAQCAFLNMMGLVDGVISNDSDVFAFGGKTLYRNFFVDNRFVEAYKIEDIESERGLTREHIIELALLEGCDYSDVKKT